jgi:uncharacterized protein
MNTTTEESKKIVIKFCEYLSNREYDLMLNLCDNKGTWYMQGRPDGPDLTYYSGTQSINEELKQAQKVLNLFTTFKYTITGITGEGERVAIESISEGKGPAEGQIYNNTYMKQFVLKDGKITNIREFLDYFQIIKYINNI